MAPRPKTICRKAGCGKLIDAPGYCAKHAQLAVGWVRSHSDKSSAERGYGYAWQQMRSRVLSAAAGLCQIKGSGCRYVAREVDHKVNKAKAREMGWTEAQIDDESNLQAACTACHKEKTRSESAAG